MNASKEEPSTSKKKPSKKRKRLRSQLTDFEKGQIIAWNEKGMSCRQIAKKLKRNHTCISRFVKRFTATKEYSRRPGTGRKRKTTDRDDRYIVRQALKKRRISASKFRNIVECSKCFWMLLSFFGTFESLFELSSGVSTKIIARICH